MAFGAEGQDVDGHADGYGGQQDAEPCVVYQDDAQNDGQPQGHYRDGLDFAGYASVLLKVTNIRAQSRL